MISSTVRSWFLIIITTAEENIVDGISQQLHLHQLNFNALVRCVFCLVRVGLGFGLRVLYPPPVTMGQSTGMNINIISRCGLIHVVWRGYVNPSHNTAKISNCGTLDVR